MPKINFDAEFKDLDGTPLKAADGAIVLKNICMNALFATQEADTRLDGNKRYDIYAIGMKISKGGTVELKSEEVATIKDRLRMTAPSNYILGAAYDMLEGVK